MQRFIALILLSALLLGGCGKKAPAPATRPQSTAAAASAVSTFARPRFANLQQSLNQLLQASRKLAAQPNDQTLQQAREAWQAAYQAFNQALPLLFSVPDNRPLLTRRIDPLPILPGYVDALKQWPDSGLVNDPTVKLSSTTLVNQNQATDDQEASLGFQVLQFLLWGTPDSPHTGNDFHNRRRSQYLQLACQQLQQDTQQAIRNFQASPPDTNALAQGAQLVRARLEHISKTAQQSGDSYLSADAATLATTQLQKALQAEKMLLKTPAGGH